jgi:hypothetical protein
MFMAGNCMYTVSKTPSYLYEDIARQGWNVDGVLGPGDATGYTR